MDDMIKEVAASPSLDELLERRGVRKSTGFADYQDFIEEKSAKGLKSGLIGLPRIYPQGSMHLALGRTQNVKGFWTEGDKGG